MDKSFYLDNYKYKPVECFLRSVFIYLLERMCKMKQYTEKQKLLATIANAIAHPARVAILEILLHQETCCHGNIAEVLSMPHSTLSQHLKVLKDAKLIEGGKKSEKVRYCINKENWQLAKDLLIGFF